MQEIELVIFDMDGLMFDTEELIYKFFKDVSAIYGYDITRGIYIKTLGATGKVVENVFKDAFGEDFPLIEIVRKTYAKIDQYLNDNQVPIKKGLYEILDYIKNENLLCAIASSSSVNLINKYLTSAKIENYFDLIVGGEQIIHSKPAPDIFLKVCKDLNIQPKKAIVIEDSENGILASFKAGIPVICIPDMKYPEKEYVEKTYAIYDSLFDVIDSNKLKKWIKNRARD